MCPQGGIPLDCHPTGLMVEVEQCKGSWKGYLITSLRHLVFRMLVLREPPGTKHTSRTAASVDVRSHPTLPGQVRGSTHQPDTENIQQVNYNASVTLRDTLDRTRLAIKPDLGICLKKEGQGFTSTPSLKIPYWAHGPDNRAPSFHNKVTK